jgi:hypothetical protein
MSLSSVVDAHTRTTSSAVIVAIAVSPIGSGARTWGLHDGGHWVIT